MAQSFVTPIEVYKLIRALPLGLAVACDHFHGYRGFELEALKIGF